MASRTARWRSLSKNVYNFFRLQNPQIPPDGAQLALNAQNQIPVKLIGLKSSMPNSMYALGGLPRGGCELLIKLSQCGKQVVVLVPCLT